MLITKACSAVVTIQSNDVPLVETPGVIAQLSFTAVIISQLTLDCMHVAEKGWGVIGGIGMKKG